MRGKHSVAVILIALVTVGGWLIINIKNPHIEPEPSIGAGHHGGFGHNGGSPISVSLKEPLNFGALVGGEIRYIDLTPNGDVYISGQSAHSYVGDVNSQRYQVQPGRLKFEVNSTRRSKYITVKFLPGELKPGVTLSNLQIQLVAASPEVEKVLSYQVPNEIKLKLNHANNCGINWRCRRNRNTSVFIDLHYGGRLTLGSHVSGEVLAPLDARISVLKKNHYAN